VLKPGGEPDLALEPIRAETGRELRVEHLEGYGSIMPEIVRQIDGRHPPAAKLALEAIPVGQPRLENFWWSEHRSAWMG
jgi:hypothetical protein